MQAPDAGEQKFISHLDRIELIDITVYQVRIYGVFQV
jgi:hypothetical protein